MEREFICKFKSGRGETRETQRQNNSAQDYTSYVQLSRWKLLGGNGLCPLTRGLNPQRRPEAAEYSRTPPRVGPCPGTMAHGTVSPEHSRFWACLQISSSTRTARSGLTTVRLDPGKGGLRNGFSPLPYFVPTFARVLEKQERVLAYLSSVHACASVCVGGEPPVVPGDGDA